MIVSRSIKQVITGLLVILSITIYAQEPPISHYNFDGCSFTDAITGSQAVMVGSPACDCAFSQDGLLLNGVDQGVDSMLVPFNYLDRDFTIRFYLNPSNAGGFFDILSKGNSCFDSTFVVTYDSGINFITASFTETPGRSVILNGELSDDICWQEIVILRRNDDYQLIINGELGSRETYEGLNVSNNAPFRISNGPCTLNDYDGIIDELSFYNRALTINEYGQQQSPDRLLSRDTIIFVGDTVFARSLVNCAETISWSPAASIDNPSMANPKLFPTETTTYAISYKSDQCFTTDTLRVIVTRPEDLDCAKLDLPSAFTPNADGINDFYGISNPFIISNLQSFDIYDRQGAIVYSGFESTDKWDGSMNGTRLNPGVYVYKIRYTCQGGEEFKIGSFTMLR